MVRVEVESVAQMCGMDCGCSAANGSCDDRGNKLRNEVSAADGWRCYAGGWRSVEVE